MIEVSVVRALHAGVMPEALCGVEIRRIGRKMTHFHVTVMFGKELQDLGLLVIRRVVLDQIDPMATAVIVRQQIFLQESQVSLGVEVFGLVTPHKLAGGHADRAQNLLGVAFSARGDLRLLAAPRPSAIKRGRLPKGRFVLVNDYRPFALGVFFRLGRV